MNRNALVGLVAALVMVGCGSSKRPSTQAQVASASSAATGLTGVAPASVGTAAPALVTPAPVTPAPVAPAPAAPAPAAPAPAAPAPAASAPAAPVPPSTPVPAMPTAPAPAAFTPAPAIVVRVPTAEVDKPRPGSTLTSRRVTFTWKTTGAPGYALWVGSQPGQSDVYKGRVSPNGFASVRNLPTDGRALHVRLFTVVGSVATAAFRDATFTAKRPAPVVVLASLTSPRAGALLPGEVAFRWNDTGAKAYLLHVGRRRGASDLGKVRGRRTSATVTGLPQDGSTVYVRLHTRTQSGWAYRDASFTTTKAPRVTVPAPPAPAVTPPPSFRPVSTRGSKSKSTGNATLGGVLLTKTWVKHDGRRVRYELESSLSARLLKRHRSALSVSVVVEGRVNRKPTTNKVQVSFLGNRLSVPKRLPLKTVTFVDESLPIFAIGPFPVNLDAQIALSFSVDRTGPFSWKNGALQGGVEVSGTLGGAAGVSLSLPVPILSVGAEVALDLISAKARARVTFRPGSVEFDTGMGASGHVKVRLTLRSRVRFIETAMRLLGIDAAKVKLNVSWDVPGLNWTLYEVWVTVLRGRLSVL